MSKMNLPNKLTIFRVILIVPFIILLLGGQAGWFGDNTFVTDMIALAIFIIASLTDLIDGKIARKYNLITDFGKFMDPLADKLLVVSAMLMFVEQHQMPAWALLLVVAREFAVTGLRLIAVDNGRVIAAAWSGKIKTASTMVAICLMLLWNIAWLNTVCWVVIVVTTVYSGVEYFVKNHDVFRKAA